VGKIHKKVEKVCSLCSIINSYQFCNHPGRAFLITFMLDNACLYTWLYNVTDGFSVLQFSWFAWLTYVKKPLFPTHKGNKGNFQDCKLPPGGKKGLLFSATLKQVSSTPQVFAMSICPLLGTCSLWLWLQHNIAPKSK